MIAAGTKLGPYEIVGSLGAGGMGEVYRARDTRLDRTVAVKVLAAHLSSSPELKQRFEREARALSSLSHPHICHLYDVGTQEGTDYLVMEFLEGETLAERLQRGALPLNEALRVGEEVAEALQVAHRAGIVHRDLKPGNVMLTKVGAKLMDFGLAKPSSLAGVSGSGSAPLLSAAATAPAPSPHTPLTGAGAIIGTIQYMSPEQIAGKEADARSDIFAFGAVLYEMASGKRPFEGKSQISVASAILEKEPEPISAARPLTPAAFEYVVKTCLEKSPDDRFQTAHDIRLQLKWISTAGSQVSAAIAPIAVRPAKRERMMWSALSAVLLLLAAALAFAWWQARSAPRQMIRATLLPPEGAQFALLNRNGPPAISPDGARIVFVADKDGKSSLWLRPLDKQEATELPGTEGAFSPFWSPDGHTIGFFTSGKMWRMDVNGGAPVAICDAANGRGGAWNKDDVILFAPNIGTRIYRVSAGGGTPTPVSASLAGIESGRWPVFLPDGHHYLYLHTPTGAFDESDEVRWASLDGKQELVLLHGGYYQAVFASGWLLTVRNGALTAQRLGPLTGKLSGSIVAVAEHVQSDELVGSAIFAAAGGVLLVQQGATVAGERIVWSDAQGKELGQIVDSGFYGESRLSPDDSRVLYPANSSGGADDLWMSDLKTGARTRVSFGGRFATSPAWSPDGRTIYFSLSLDEKQPAQIYSRPADGSRPQQLVMSTTDGAFVTDVSPDGKYLLYEEKSGDFSALKALPLSGTDKKPLLLLDHLSPLQGALSGAFNARVSPAGGWLAYESNENGQSEVYVTKFPGGGGKYQVSLSGGSQPVWSRDGKRLYYLDPSQKMVEVDVAAAKDAVQLGRPNVLFQTGVRASIVGGGFDVSRDGRFLLINSVTESSAPLTLITNWDSGLESAAKN